jgi:glycerophosphoryl diester phosphodiesterase
MPYTRKRQMSRTASYVAANLATIVSVLVIAIAPGAANARPITLMEPLRQPGEAADIAAHRGDRAHAPENTLPAFEEAIRRGSDYVETDVQLTADGYAVLMHDETVDRTTNGTGRVGDFTLAELRTLDAGGWYDSAFTGVQVPLLDEFLALLQRSPEVTALVELKDSWTPPDVASLMTSVYRHDVQDRLVFASFSPTSVQSLRDVAPGIPRVLIRRVLPLDPVAVAERYGAIGLMTRSSALEARPDAVAAMHAAGLGVLVYTLNSEDRWGEALGYGVDVVVTDKPSALDKWIAETAPGT